MSCAASEPTWDSLAAHCETGAGNRLRPQIQTAKTSKTPKEIAKLFAAFEVFAVSFFRQVFAP